MDNGSEDESALWRQYREAPASEEKKKAGELVYFYLPLVARVVDQLSIQVQNHIERDELINIGVIGLYEAVRRYKHSREVKFFTFARKRIRGAILDELRKRDPLTRDQRRNYHTICETFAKLLEEQERFPTNREVAEKLNMKEGDVAAYLGMGGEIVALEEEVEEGVTYKDAIPDPSDDSPADEAIRESQLQQMRAGIRQLTTREQQILFLRHHEDLRTREIAKVLEISPGRVSQMYNGIISKLRTIMKITEDKK